MRLTRVEMYNFGAYKGRNCLNFHGGKPVVLVGGMNGRGKTTLLEAILTALYGPGSFAFEESGYSTFGQYLKAKTNLEDGTGVGRVAVEFVQRGEEKIKVERSWNAKASHIRPDIVVSKGSGIDEYLTANWASYIEEIVPRALSSFFFFDGEKIADMALDGNDTKIRESIRSLLGVSTIDSLRRDLASVSKRVAKTSKQSVAMEDAECLGDEVMELKGKIEGLDVEIASLKAAEASLNREIEVLVDDLAAAGGGIAAERASLKERMSDRERQFKDVRERQLALCAGVAPLQMLADKLPGLLERAERGYRSKAFAEAVDWLAALAKGSVAPTDKGAILGFLDRAQDDLVSCGDGLPADRNAVAELSSLVQTALPASSKEYAALRGELDRVETEIATIERMVLLEADTEVIDRIRSTINRANQRLSEARVNLARATSERASLNGEYVHKNAEYKRVYASYLENLNAVDGDARAQRYIALADTIFERFGKKLQKEKTEALSKEITAKFCEMANKKSLINNVTVDSDTLEISYWSPDGTKLDRALLSAGEKQLMVIATLWALANCSGKKLPVIIDTPLARLDSAHRMSVVCNYFPHAGEQVIVLSTDSEIYGEYYAALLPSVSDEYTLVFDDKERATTIRRGYFGTGGVW